jgi:anti-sigma B factor antagonist
VTIRKARLRIGSADCAIHVLDFKGSLGGETFRGCDDWITALIEAGAIRLVACCTELDYLSSAGIGVLAGAVKRCRDAGGDLRFCAVDEDLRKVLQLVGLEALVRSYDTERGAVMSFKYE